MLRRSLLCLSALALCLDAPAGAQSLPVPARSVAQTPPRLLVVISVDQLSADLFNRYRPSFTGGLRRIAGGTVFARGYQAHAATETCPGHSTILTGANPARTGIVGNNWFELAKRPNRAVYCAEDIAAAPEAGARYAPSAGHLLLPTLGERLKAANPRSRSVAVAGKDRATLMMGGKKIDQAWWWDASARRFVGRGSPAPAPVGAAVNANLAAALARPREPLPLSPRCAALSRPVRAGEVTVGTGRFARAAGDVQGFQRSPELDGATLALAAGLVQQLELGRAPGGAPDLLAIGLSATDYVGHAYGSGGGEMCLQMESLDRDLGEFLGFLDGLRVPYAVALTADHGAHDVPERSGPHTERADPGLTAEAIGKQVGAALGLAGPVLRGEGGFGDVYVDLGVPAARRAAVIADAAARFRAHRQVEAVFLADELARQPLPTGAPDRWTLAQRVRAAFHQPRNGQLIVVPKATVSPVATPRPGYVATHGTPWDPDRMVPIAFYGPGIARADRVEAASTVDILPTLAAMLRVNAPAPDGRCLDVARGLCRGR